MENNVQVYILKLSGEENEDTVLEMLRHLPAHSQERFSAYSNLRSKIQSLAGEVLARYATGHYIGQPFNLGVLQTGKNGKPYFASPKHIHFNISHSGKYIVCGVSTSEIGIDVERIRRVNLRIAERYFSEREMNDLLQLNEDERMEYFITLWTIKEAYLKSIGRGLTQKLNTFTITKIHEQYKLTGNKQAEKFDVASLRLDTNYVLAVCSSKKFILEPILFLNTSELMVQ